MGYSENDKEISITSKVISKGPGEKEQQKLKPNIAFYHVLQLIQKIVKDLQILLIPNIVSF